MDRLLGKLKEDVLEPPALGLEGEDRHLGADQDVRDFVVELAAWRCFRRIKKLDAQPARVSIDKMSRDRLQNGRQDAGGGRFCVDRSPCAPAGFLASSAQTALQAKRLS
ncbi:hypothetical protein [Mesorhizobium sp.]|uniref:hypothetical protein n=1 Tax=Mesorhizobium sp. TaxID=1871066 RepID=UPI000FC9C0D0|nr:hypothetical protein [Mesorhizobium sp.]RUW00568.1 hypothetical protein EOA49_14955 [Mesorhizobium sp. M1A.F.Ca.IN.020.04.1.1]RUW12488.1 hypothetical protein EOA53_10455 [Mesorhizobium sp. M1A.F.Ca.IN.020.03.1.1]RWF71269.1 MAG: hypothetical protein EOQ34_15890 [Mesorhizobium sp.]RWG14803.1 MAG: hypothetical protein EOQ58_13510 [Mesorhizobium sp.]RWG36515.1 MAG: hypothetical protein EOQ61_00730 [Mesorhizobium sp.]